MCDAVLIAAIPDELGYFDEKKEKDNKVEIPDGKHMNDNPKNNGEEEK